MLVLSRKRTEKIRIGQNVTVTVLRFSGNRVSLGIAAPLDVSVVRDELAPEATANDSRETPAALAFKQTAKP